MNSEHIYQPNSTGSYPPSLITNDHWSLMDLTWSSTDDKVLKTPKDVQTGETANCDEMGVSFERAKQHLAPNRVMNYRHPGGSEMYFGLIDCDHRVGRDGRISPLVQNVLRYMDTYAEFSVNNGIHVLGWLDAIPPCGNKDRAWELEFYWSTRSVPITGNRVVLADWTSPTDLEPRTKKFLALHKVRFPDSWKPPTPIAASSFCSLSQDEILAKIFGEATGSKWAEIYAGNWQPHYTSPSDADLALLMKLAFYTGKDRQLMDGMFRGSPLSKILLRGEVDHPKLWRSPKWNNDNYRNKTLDAAINNTRTVYSPRPRALSAQESYTLRARKIHEERNK